MKLENISSPAELRALSEAELTDLATQMRGALLEKLSRHGGHIGPNLGMVEATIALHYVFDAPTDQIVWDVSHQSYGHKMLTGRAKAFTDPAHYDDVTGYTNPQESPYDLFTVGHTSTSVSLATGLAKARDLQGGKWNVVAVIGDGSLSGGEAFEGLDNGAVLHSNFIVVVNDNEMSIAENHGGLYADLRLLRNTRGQADNNYFRSLGYAYRFVPNGNSISALIKAFSEVKDSPNPVVVHIVTEKGHGYKPAVADKERFHWGMPFDLATGNPLSADDTPDYADFTYDLLKKRLENDSRLVVLTAGTPGLGGFTPERRAEFGPHFVDVGIAEEQAAAMSSGLAKNGMRPFWMVHSSFVQRAYDQISQDIAINNSPAVIAVLGGSVYGIPDVTHLGWFDQTLLANIPNVVYLAPADRDQYADMVKWSLDQTEHPVVIRVPVAPLVSLGLERRDDYSDLNTYQLVRTGHGVAIVAAGNMLAPALKAADLLAADGIVPTVINPCFLSGIDAEMLSSLSEDHTAVLTVEDALIDGGMGQKIASFFGDRPMLVKNLGLPKTFVDGYDAGKMAADNYLTAEGIAEQARRMFK